MIRSLLAAMIRKFEQQYNYDAKYMHEINEVSVNASLRLLSFSAITNYRSKETAIWGGAALAATVHGDCGPCTQLMVDRLIELKIPHEQIRYSLKSEFDSAGALGLGYQFAHAVLKDSSELNLLSNRIKSEHGQEALIAAAYAASTYATYPLLKRALGHSIKCHMINVGDESNIRISNAA